MPYRPQARPEAIAAILLAGGHVTDSDGHATRQLADSLVEINPGRDPATVARGLVDLLRAMERDGVIVRETAGRRTFTIWIDPNCPFALVAEAIVLLHQRQVPAAQIVEALETSGLLDDGEQFKELLSGTEHGEGAATAVVMRHGRLVDVERRFDELEEELDSRSTRLEEQSALLATVQAQLDAARQFISQAYAALDDPPHRTAGLRAVRRGARHSPRQAGRPAPPGQMIG